MTVPDTSRPSRLGVHRVGYIFEDAGIIFREITVTDIGIDAEIELARDGVSLGKLARIQIKSGDSFVNKLEQTFTFRAKVSSFKYWRRFCLPVFGIVYSPSLEIGVWLDLSEISKTVPDNQDSYQVTTRLTERNEFNVKNAQRIAKLVEELYERPVDFSYIENIDRGQTVENEESEQPMTEDEAWKYLVSVFLSSKSAPDILADAGYRISWYFPGVDPEKQNFFKNRIRHVTDEELANIVSGSNDALEKDREDAANLICDLVSYLPYKVRRLKILAKSGIVPEEHLEALFQMIEYFTENFEDKLRAKTLSQYASRSK